MSLFLVPSDRNGDSQRKISLTLTLQSLRTLPMLPFCTCSKKLFSLISRFLWCRSLFQGVSFRFPLWPHLSPLRKNRGHSCGSQGQAMTRQSTMFQSNASSSIPSSENHFLQGRKRGTAHVVLHTPSGIFFNPSKE